MHTVGSARAWAIEELKRAEIKSPVLSADLLLGFILGWDRVRVLSHCEESLSADQWEYLQDRVRRRIHREPIQYLTGEQEFYGLVFRVGPGTLIPRPETEILVENAIDLMRGHSLSGARFLDIGTGSGCIAISIAHEVPFAVGWGVDISPAAIQIARGNTIRHGVAERILLIRSDRLQCFPQKPLFDFILCNPPYVALKDCDSLPSEVRDHEPHTALFGGESGLEFYISLVPEVPSRLATGGYLLLELGAGQSEQVKQIVQREGISVERILNDLQGIPRCLVGRKL
jgi:release factor glutamine methyltransferase